jgi:hypothetical protein
MQQLSEAVPPHCEQELRGNQRVRDVSLLNDKYEKNKNSSAFLRYVGQVFPRAVS